MELPNLYHHPKKRGTNQYANKYKTVWGLTPNAWLKILIVLMVLGMLLAIILWDKAWAEQLEKASNTAVGTFKYQEEVAPNYKDARANKVYRFLKQHDSPLRNEAEFFVSMADKYALPYNLSAAISCKESSCGRHLAGDFNAWGITTGKSMGPRFASYKDWHEGIEAHARLLSTGYRYDMVKGIQQRYCPEIECDEAWAEQVTQFSNEISKEEYVRN